MSAASSEGALDGLKKSVGDIVPPLFTFRSITDSASCPGGLLPGPFDGETPLPEVTKIRPCGSSMAPLPPCQMPAWS